MAHLYIFTAHNLGNTDSWSINPGSYISYRYVICSVWKLSPVHPTLDNSCYNAWLVNATMITTADQKTMSHDWERSRWTLHKGLYQTIHGRVTSCKINRIEKSRFRGQTVVVSTNQCHQSTGEIWGVGLVGRGWLLSLILKLAPTQFMLQMAYYLCHLLTEKIRGFGASNFFLLKMHHWSSRLNWYTINMTVIIMIYLIVLNITC